MLILRPYEHKILLPQQRQEWYAPKGQLNRWRLTAYTHDGVSRWRGWFDDREDADAFLSALIRCQMLELPLPRELWRLPTPWWDDSLAGLLYELAGTSFLTTPTGSNQTYTSPADWNNASNTIDTIAAGGSGAAVKGTSTEVNVGGGGGAAWNEISNFSFAVPGTTTATWRVGAGGVAVVAPTNSAASGNAGGDTWFNGTTLVGSSVGSEHGGGGTHGLDATLVVGGAKGTGVNGVGTLSNNGGNGGSIQAAHTGGCVCGGGGAGGPNGTGGAIGQSSGSTSTALNGGDGEKNAGPADGLGGNAPSVGSGTKTGGNGSDGTHWTTHGPGGAGAAASSTSGIATGGDGASGGGGGGARSTAASTVTSGKGGDGIIVITYLLAGGGFPFKRRTMHPALLAQ